MRSISFNLKQYSRSVLLVTCMAFLGFSAYAQADAAKGEALFKAKCTTCHKIDQQLVGPPLGPQIGSGTDDAYLVKWIENNQALIAAKNPRALTIYAKFNQSNMTVFPDLTDADATNIITYVRGEWKNMQATAAKAPAANAVTTESGPSDLVILALIGVIVLAFIIILVLNKVISTLERLLLKNQGLYVEEVEVERASVDRLATVKKLLKNKKLVFFVLLCGTVAMGSWTWVTLWNTNVHTGYQPVQPIKFPHDLHAGAMKIDCQYCHSGAYKSKNASIPSLNVCMNCHKVVKTESPEIHKIYDALGYNRETQKYDSTKSRPMQWIRVHNLPDLVYFNHSQHVKVAGLKCQTCHGPVETMKEVYQYSPLTMKWCIQCHKRTDVNMKGNAYYENMIQVHDLIKHGKQVTAAAMGGIECGKCHY
ncbi:MAG: c-type cytochrome [Bacteroidota bacterium]|nr:c-type cytochrome [Bacteroidota bacterium]